jgi:O-antigen ligase
VTALYFPQLGINFKNFGKPRWIGITTHPNSLGLQALVLIWLSSNLFFLTKSKFEKSLIFFALIAGFFTIIKADSITSLITAGVITALTCYYYFFNRLSLSNKIILFTFGLLSFLFLVTFYMNTSELVSSTFESTGRNSTFSGRAIQWEIAIREASDNLIFGLGFDELEFLTKKYQINMRQLHNGFIEVLVKGGLIACLLLAFTLIRTFFHQIRIKLSHKHDFIFFNTGLIMVLLHNVTESSILQGLSTLSIFLLFIVVSTSLVKETNSSKLAPTGY